jgi:hypothetical protein
MAVEPVTILSRSPPQPFRSRDIETGNDQSLEAAQLVVATNGDSASWLAVASVEEGVSLALLGMIDWCAPGAREG